MKVEELMIGDWVQNQDGSIKGRIVNIDAYQNRVEFGAHTIDADFVYPIPLTEEILESNNYQSKEDPYNHRKFFFLGKNEYNLDVYFDNGTIILVEADYEPTIYAYMCDCKYVHNFQHILKDLKIEKEIAL